MPEEDTHLANRERFDRAISFTLEPGQQLQSGVLETSKTTTPPGSNP